MTHDAVRTALAEVFEPLQLISEVLAEHCVTYVYDGSDSDVLLVLEQNADPDLPLLMCAAGRVQWPWGRVSSARAQVFPDRDLTDVDHARGIRARLYANPSVTAAQFGRLGRVFAAIGEGPDRALAGVPPWLMALTNDVAMSGTLDRHRGGLLPYRGVFPTELNRWTPEFLLDIARTQDVPESTAPAVVVQSLFQELSGRRWAARNEAYRLPGVSEFVRDHAEEIPATAMNKLVADGRIAFMKRIYDDGIVFDQAAHIAVEFVMGTVSSVRNAGLHVVEQVSVEALSEVVSRALVKATPKKAEPLITHLATTDQGAVIVARAVELNPALAPQLERLDERRTLLAEQQHDTPEFVVPSFEPLPDEVPAQVAHDLHTKMERLARNQEGNLWIKDLQQAAASVTKADIAELIEVAEGKRQKTARITKVVPSFHLINATSHLNLVHLMRLYPDGRGWDREPGLDVRIIIDAFERAGASTESLYKWIAYSYAVDIDDVWMWAYENPQIIQVWLKDDRASRALQMMTRYPQISAEFLPQLAILALGNIKMTRELARKVLAKHPAARQLAKEGLSDTKADMRRSAAEWLQTLGDPAAIPALQTALKKERSEVVQAALLAALESLGASIAEFLAPEVLAKEAAKGLRAKVPAALDWFELDSLPAVRWADGDHVDAKIIRWWVVLAVKLKDPDGSGLLDRYLSLLHPDDAAALGQFCLQAWVSHDTKSLSEQECWDRAAVQGRYEWENWQDRFERMSKRDDIHPEWLEETRQQAARPVEVLIKSYFEECRNTCIGSAINAKGMLALTTCMPGQHLVTVLDTFIKRWPARRAQIEALTIALYGNGDQVALQKLLAVARRFKQVTVQAKAQELVEQLADKRGWTTDQLADRTIPEAGFESDRLLHLDYGPREFLGRVTTAGTIELSTAEGTVIKSLPTARQGDDEELVKEAKKQLTASRRELKSVVELQSARLYEAMCLERRWNAGEWKQFLLQHPLMSQLVTRLVWMGVDDHNPSFFRPVEDGSLIDVNDELVEVADEAQLALAHRVLMSAEEAQAWQKHLADYRIAPLFSQFAADVTGFDATAEELDQWDGYLTDAFSIRNVAKKRGYQRDLQGEAWFGEYIKEFTSLGLTAVLEFTGSYVPEENISAAVKTMSIRKRNRMVPLGDVPRVLLAEIAADYAAFGAVGIYDPNYRDKV